MIDENPVQYAEAGGTPPGHHDERYALARWRTHLALDRTLLAWIRTGLSMLSFGFGMVAFFRAVRLANPDEQTARLHRSAIGFGIALLVLGLVAMLVAALYYKADVERLRRGQALAMRQRWLSFGVVLILTFMAVSGLLALWVF